MKDILADPDTVEFTLDNFTKNRSQEEIRFISKVKHKYDFMMASKSNEGKYFFEFYLEWSEN